MEISAGASRIYRQYQSLTNRLKDGDVNYQDAIAEFDDLATESRGYDGLKLVISGANLTRVKPMDMPVESLQSFINILKTMGVQVSEQLYAAQAYNAGNSHNVVNDVQQKQDPVATGDRPDYSVY